MAMHMTAIAPSIPYPDRVAMVDAATCIDTGALLSIDAGGLAGLVGLSAQAIIVAALAQRGKPQ